MKFENITPEEAVRRLTEITTGNDDPDIGHKRADSILLKVVPAEVAEAWLVARQSCDGTLSALGVTVTTNQDGTLLWRKKEGT